MLEHGDEQEVRQLLFIYMLAERIDRETFVYLIVDMTVAGVTIKVLELCKPNSMRIMSLVNLDGVTSILTINFRTPSNKSF